ncbi:MAG: FAD-dependent oxidoreductase [Candidatus Marinimicrobia bacterium]|nr:FAD-dependent oxidoreductase [Candidatus Neomarinimicrobiota bacterium]
MKADTRPFKLPAARLESALGDAKPPYSDSEALIEANRCLYCFDAPCITACPTGIDIPSFIKKIATGNLRGSARTIFASNMMGISTARVCPVEELCVGACVYNGLNGQPIQIGRLQRYATTKALEQEAASSRPLFTAARDRGKRVALVGAGPASLACAAYLALEGVTPVIFEKSDLPGGLNTTGVAPYKFNTEDSLQEIEWLLGLGIELRTGVTVGADPSLLSLVESHDAVFLGVGLGADHTLGLPGEDGPGVWGATDLIRAIKNRPGFKIPADVGTVLVVGGGNTSIDIARELAMLGVASVTLVYRRTEREMSAYAHELSGARRYGVRLRERLRPVKILRDGERVTGLRMSDLASASEVDLACDWVVLAIGQAKITSGLVPEIQFDDHGRVRVDPKTRRTQHPKIFAGGDCINGGQEVVNAAADGREAAFAMLKDWGVRPALAPTAPPAAMTAPLPAAANEMTGGT